MLGVFVFVANWRIVVFRRLVSRGGMLCLSRMRRTLWLKVSEIKGRLSVSGVGRLFCSDVRLGFFVFFSWIQEWEYPLPGHTVSKSYDSASKDFVASFASRSHCCFGSVSW